MSFFVELETVSVPARRVEVTSFDADGVFIDGERDGVHCAEYVRWGQVRSIKRAAAPRFEWDVVQIRVFTMTRMGTTGLMHYGVLYYLLAGRLVRERKFDIIHLGTDGLKRFRRWPITWADANEHYAVVEFTRVRGGGVQ